MPGRLKACNRSCGASVGDFQPMPFSLVFSRGFIVFGIQWVNMPVKVKRPFCAVKMLLKIDLGRCSYIWPGFVGVDWFICFVRILIKQLSTLVRILLRVFLPIGSLDQVGVLF